MAQDITRGTIEDLMHGLQPPADPIAKAMNDLAFRSAANVLTEREKDRRPPDKPMLPTAPERPPVKRRMRLVNILRRENP